MELFDLSVNTFYKFLLIKTNNFGSYIAITDEFMDKNFMTLNSGKQKSSG